LGVASRIESIAVMIKIMSVRLFLIIIYKGVLIMNERIYINWDDIAEHVFMTYKNEMNFNHAAINCYLADECKDYE
jgi:hypothetical protein